MNRVLIPVMGFQQCGREVTGMELVWREWRRLSSPQTWVLPPQLWNCDPEAVAAQVARNTLADARIIVAAYSWGGGHFFPRFAESLEKLDRRVAHAILCDPVYCASLWSFRWRALLPGARIPVPASVDRVTWFYQRSNRPAGHEPRAIDPDRTVIKPGVHVPTRVHAQMDEAPEFVAECLRAGGSR